MYTEVLNEFSDKLNNMETKLEVFDEVKRIEVLDTLNELANKIEEIRDLSFDLVSKNEAVFVLFRFKDTSGYTCKSGIKLKENFYSSIEYILNSIIEGQRIIKIINDKLDIIQANSGIILNIKYRWGFSTTSSIAYWDYTHIAIRLNEKSIVKLLEEYNTEESINNLLVGFTWSDNIIDLIINYNKLDISNKIESKLDYSTMEEALTENMLSITDVEKIINQNIDKHSSQRLKSVHIISELGLFAAILLWDIDYETKDISVDILEDTVLDIENNRFVSDHSLYSRIEQRILNEADEVSKRFKSITS